MDNPLRSIHRAVSSSLWVCIRAGHRCRVFILKKMNRPGFMIYSNTWYYYPSPKRWAVTELCLAAHSGNLTPPRISPGCPHWLCLWLGRGTIVGGSGHGETACQCCFGIDGNRSPPSLAVFDAGYLHRRVLAHPPHRLSPLGAGPLM